MEIVLSIVVFAGAIGIFYFWKRDKQKRNISIAVALISFLLFGIFFTGDEEDAFADADIDEQTEVVEEEQVVDEPVEEDVEEKITEEPIEEDEAPRALDNFEHGITEDIDTYVNSSGVTWSPEQHTEHFLMDASDIVRYEHENLQNGVIFLSKNEFVDNYGNEETLNSIILYLSPETINKINFDNEIWGSSPNDMYGVADAMWIHSEFQNDEFTGISGASDDSIPQTYFNLIGQ